MAMGEKECWSKIVAKRSSPSKSYTNSSDANSLLESCKSSNGISIAVVDANAIIKGGEQLMKSSDRFVSIAEVIDEVRDPVSRHRLSFSPFPVDTIEPSPESLMKVIDFARATGDLQTLSRVDLKLIALTYTLESEIHGTKHLRDAPPPVKTLNVKRLPEKELPGWGNNVPNLAEWEALDLLIENTSNSTSRISPVSGLNLNSLSNDTTGGEYFNNSTEKKAITIDDKHLPGSCVESEDKLIEDVHQTSEVLEASSENDESIHDRVELESIDEEFSRMDISNNTGFDTSSLEDDISEQNWKMRSLSESSVACITGDFAMQNVVLQMGLRLLAPGGMQVRKLHRWVLKCHACYTVTTEIGRIFCPKCGNGGTLRKVSITVGEDGVVLSACPPRITLRGTKFSLPLPQGGRDAVARNPVLREDQLPRKVRHPRTKKRASKEEDFFTKDEIFYCHGNDKRSPLRPPVGKAITLFSGRRNPNDNHFSRRRH